MPTNLRRLPGFRFETQAPPARDVLPRMDVAVFVGFAASGPLHLPVAVEDPAAFAAIYGADLPLAWNAQTGEQAYAYLAPAVRAFFRCGGRRCYVIRVAGAAQTNSFPLPGIAQVDLDAAGQVADIRPAVAQARSEGSWSDTLRVSTALLSRSVRVSAVKADQSIMVDGDVEAGDLLRLTYRDSGTTCLVVVAAVEATETGGLDLTTSPRRTALRATPRYSLWLRELEEANPPPAIGSARVYGLVESGEDLPVLKTEIETRDDTVLLSLQVPLALAGAPPPGSMVTVDLGPEWLLLSVREARGDDDSDSPPQETIWITCTGVRWLKTAPTPAELPLAERLTFELRARPASGDYFSLVDLAFSLEHPRSWKGLPIDQQSDLPEGDRNGLPTDGQWFSAVGEHQTAPELWKEAAEPRFPLSGGLPDGDFTFPFAVSVLPEHELVPYSAPDDALTRDGLAEFASALFLDEALAGTTALDLAGRADYIRYLSPESRPLRGIHAALAIEEATLIAVPDALQPGWTREDAPLGLDVAPPTPVEHPDWSRFVDCDYHILNRPVLTARQPDIVGTFTLTWEWESTDPSDEPLFVLEEAVLPDFSGPVTLYSGAAQAHTIYGKARGDYYYRVRVSAGVNVSGWSNGVGVRVAPGSQWTLKGPNVEAQRISLTIQRSLVRMCAARGDMVAVLAMPQEFREDAAIEHARALSPFSTLLNPDDLFDFPLSFAEERASTYAALYHPWLYTRDGTIIRATPPDGTMCGMIARRAIERGAWIAPANEPIEGVLALTPPWAENRWLDALNAQINIIKPSPYGFIAQTADTLSLDVDLRPLNVRRLMILLRRLVLRQGTKYVFEPFDDVFRRMTQHSLESVLAGMFARGAFAGATAASAFQVVPRSTAQDVDQGRFIMDLRVAPSLPMEFLTVR
ncbi:MAG TPA: hypothetical protein VGE04_11455, partial [Chloroflexia bacterium]